MASIARRTPKVKHPEPPDGFSDDLLAALGDWPEAVRRAEWRDAWASYARVSWRITSATLTAPSAATATVRGMKANPASTGRVDR